MIALFLLAAARRTEPHAPVNTLTHTPIYMCVLMIFLMHSHVHRAIHCSCAFKHEINVRIVLQFLTA